MTHMFQVLNQIVYELPAEHPLAESRPLRELLGHTPPQVRVRCIRSTLCLLLLALILNLSYIFFCFVLFLNLSFPFLLGGI